MNMKSSVYPAAIAAALVGIVVLGLGLLNFSISIEPIEPETATLPDIVPSTQSQPTTAPISPTAVPTLGATSTQKLEQDTSTSSSESNQVANPGALRISNQTDQPVRVALLAQKSASNSSNGKTTYGEPVHWDFAPGEGSNQGLVLSLPEGNLKLEKGDILVAFAQDGSRRYWGPYVVGDTDAPIHNSKTGEWQLILTRD